MMAKLRTLPTTVISWIQRIPTALPDYISKLSDALTTGLINVSLLPSKIPEMPSGISKMFYISDVAKLERVGRLVDRMFAVFSMLSAIVGTFFIIDAYWLNVAFGFLSIPVSVVALILVFPKREKYENAMFAQRNSKDYFVEGPWKRTSLYLIELLIAIPVYSFVKANLANPHIFFTTATFFAFCMTRVMKPPFDFGMMAMLLSFTSSLLLFETPVPAIHWTIWALIILPIGCCTPDFQTMEDRRFRAPANRMMV